MIFGHIFGKRILKTGYCIYLALGFNGSYFLPRQCRTFFEPPFNHILNLFFRIVILLKSYHIYAHIECSVSGGGVDHLNPMVYPISLEFQSEGGGASQTTSSTVELFDDTDLTRARPEGAKGQSRMVALFSIFRYKIKLEFGCVDTDRRMFFYIS